MEKVIKAQRAQMCKSWGEEKKRGYYSNLNSHLLSVCRCSICRLLPLRSSFRTEQDYFGKLEFFFLPIFSYNRVEKKKRNNERLNERLQRSVFKQARSYCGNVINADFLEMLKKRDNKDSSHLGI